MENIKKILLDSRETDKYQRVDVSNPVAWYVGLDAVNRYSLFAIVETKPSNLSSTKIINLFIGNRRDGKYGITFSLTEKKSIDLFVHFCEDMISNSRNIKKPENVTDSICSRYIQWQRAFIRTEGKLLSFEQIKGLIGELYFLKMVMIPKYGHQKAVGSWSGIESTDQDFLCDNTWYEVKSTVSGSGTVKISSVEQLDTEKEGHLVVIILDKTSEADTSKITLNNMVELVTESIPEKVLQDRLMSNLLAYGYYYDEAYDRIGFRFNGMSQFRVDQAFPCLRKDQIPASAQNVKYELVLAAIEAFKED